MLFDGIGAAIARGRRGRVDAEPEPVADEAAAEIFNDLNSQPRGPPPCSERALALLPRVAITPTDLVIDCNRLCSICLEPHSLHEVAVRLPCAHLFHSACIIPWLQTRSCLCPVCRYELPTDDAEFERNRVERMRHRKPRFYEHELSLLSVTQLKLLGPKPIGCCDVPTWIQHLRDTSVIEVIPTPPPVVLRWTDLQNMSLTTLKATMNDAGVFYDPKMVLEKSDLYSVFRNSGRLHLIQDKDDDKDGNVDERPIEEEVEILSYSGQGLRRNRVVMQTKRDGNVMVETVTEDEEDFDVNHDNFDVCHLTANATTSAAQLEISPFMTLIEPVNTESILPMQEPIPQSMSHFTMLDIERHLNEWRVDQLREYANQLDMDLSYFSERCDIVLQVANAVRCAFDSMQTWVSCELQAVASVLHSTVLHVDVLSLASTSSSASLSASIGELQHVLLKSPRFAFILSGMKHFQGLAVAELQRIAHSWKLDVTDCLEKSELVERLLLHHGHRSTSTSIPFPSHSV